MTQVITPSPDDVTTHNRLTHSLKVAQVARSIAERLLWDEDNREAILELGGLDADVVEAAALAHDLGHPPFGHAGEATLDAYARDCLNLSDGFEGNAQTFRIIAALDPRRDPTGMYLTAATQAAVLKYPWSRAQPTEDEAEPRNDLDYRLQRGKFSWYATEEVTAAEARAWLPPGYPEHAQSLEAAIMDVADDITYALHDLEDFYLAGVLATKLADEELRSYMEAGGAAEPGVALVPGSRIARLSSKLAADYPHRYSQDEFMTAVSSVTGHMSAFSGEFDGSVASISRVRTFVSHQIGHFLNDLEPLRTGPSLHRPPLELRPGAWHQVQVLKELTKSFVVGRVDMASVQRGQQRLLRELLNRLKEWWDDERDVPRLPSQLLHQRRMLEVHTPDHASRALIDYVSGLTDHQAVRLHERLHGGLDSITRGFVI